MRNEELIVAHIKYAFGIVNRRYRQIGDSNFKATLAEADEACSVVLVPLLIAGRSFDGRGTFRGWISIRIAGALDDWFTSRRLRYGLTCSGRRKREDWQNPFVDATEDNGGSVEMSGVNELRPLHDALRALPHRDADVLRRRFMQDEDCESIAAALGVSPGRISQLTKRGARLLREELALRGVRKVADLV